MLRKTATAILFPLSYILSSKENSASWLFDHESLKYFWKREYYYDFPWIFGLFFSYCRFAPRKGSFVIGAQRLHTLISRLVQLTGRKCTGFLYDGQRGFHLALDDARSIVVPSEVEHASGELGLKKYLGAGDTFIDIGANHGSYAIAASGIVGVDGSVLAIEPQERLAEMIQKSLSLSVCKNTMVFQCACGIREGVGRFWVPNATSGSAGLYRNFSAREAATEISVPIRRLDDIVGDCSISGQVVIKIDVEGAEVDCLMGGLSFIRRYHPTSIVEINPIAQKAAGRGVNEIATVLEQLEYSHCGKLGDGHFLDIAEANRLYPSREGDHVNIVFCRGGVIEMVETSKN